MLLAHVDESSSFHSRMYHHFAFHIEFPRDNDCALKIRIVERATIEW
jgi:hypothetical protein